MKKSTINAIVTFIVYVSLIFALCGEFGEETKIFAKWIFFPWLVQTVLSNWHFISKVFLKLVWRIEDALDDE